MSIVDLLGKEIVVYGFTKSNSNIDKKQPCYKIQFANEFIDDKPQYKVIFTSSIILGKQLEKYKNQMPFRATIISQNKYYIFV